MTGGSSTHYPAVGRWSMARARAIFIQPDIWRWLQKNPGSSSTQIAQALGITKCSASLALSRMKRNGSASMSYKPGFRAARHAIWRAEGKRPPTNNSGQAVGSLEQLKAGWLNWESSLMAAAKALGHTYTPRKPKVPTQQIDAHPISQSWMIPFSRKTNSAKRG